MLKDMLSTSAKTGKRIAFRTAHTTKAASVKMVNTTVRMAKKSTNFIADTADRIPEIGASK